MANCVVNFDENGSIFLLLDDTAKGHGTYYKYGDFSFNQLEILSDNLTGSIKYAERFNCLNIVIDDLFLPEAEDMHLIERNHVIFSGPDVDEDFDYHREACGSFSLCFNKDELDIVFSSEFNPKYYQKNGRVEIYTDANDDILYMRIRDLQPWEFDFLKAQKVLADRRKEVISKKYDIR